MQQCSGTVEVQHLQADSSRWKEPHESALKWHLDRFSRFSQYISVTDTQTTIRATFVAIGRICAMRAMRPDNNNAELRVLACNIRKNGSCRTAPPRSMKRSWVCIKHLHRFLL